LLVGSARGIGEATARTFAKNGASVLIVDILEEQAKKVADDLSKGNQFISLFFYKSILQSSQPRNSTQFPLN
jgi:3alpha(or 20beta)-hydroxysteroid dehydrogenase